MRPSFSHPSIELSPPEQTIILRIKRAKLFVFLRAHRHELFDDAFQEELATLYAPHQRGCPPVSPAQLALATVLQAYIGVSDDESLRQRSWTGAGSSFWTAWTLIKRRSAKAHLSPFVNG